MTKILPLQKAASNEDFIWGEDYDNFSDYWRKKFLLPVNSAFYQSCYLNREYEAKIYSEELSSINDLYVSIGSHPSYKRTKQFSIIVYKTPHSCFLPRFEHSWIVKDIALNYNINQYQASYDKEQKLLTIDLSFEWEPASQFNPDSWKDINKPEPKIKPLSRYCFTHSKDNHYDWKMKPTNKLKNYVSEEDVHKARQLRLQEKSIKEAQKIEVFRQKLELFEQTKRERLARQEPVNEAELIKTIFNI